MSAQNEGMKYLIRLSKNLRSSPAVAFEQAQSQSSNVQELVHNFLELPWFSRRWIVQELVLNSHVTLYCGPDKISWQRLQRAIGFVPMETWRDDSGLKIYESLLKFGDLWRIWSIADSKGTDCRLLSLLHIFHHFECTETKDRVYALVGIASDAEVAVKGKGPLSVKSSGLLGITPDYSLSDDGFFKQFAVGRMKFGSIFTTIACAGFHRRPGTSQSLPSWVPDFRLQSIWNLGPQEPRFVSNAVIQHPFSDVLILNRRTHIPENWKTTCLKDTDNKWDSITVQHTFINPLDSGVHEWSDVVVSYVIQVKAFSMLSSIEERVLEKTYYGLIDGLKVKMSHSSHRSVSIFQALSGRCLFIYNSVSIIRRGRDLDFILYHYPRVRNFRSRSARFEG
jgi:hypothetical protein